MKKRIENALRELVERKGSQAKASASLRGVSSATISLILSGKGEEIYSQHFRYNGFRYVLVEGITEQQATPELLTYLVMSSDLNSIGGFRCSNEKLNKLYSMVDNANRSNFYYFPTDCPHREKNGWTGDAAVSAEQMTLMYDTESSFREWLANIRKSQTEWQPQHRSHGQH